MRRSSLLVAPLIWMTAAAQNQTGPRAQAPAAAPILVASVHTEQGPLFGSGSQVAVAVGESPRNADLAALGKMIGNATMVSTTEGTHGAAEPLDFRNRLFQYLVQEKGFTAIAIESGLVEGRVVHDYVRGGEGDLPTVVATGISWTMDRLPQNVALVGWLRDYNGDPRHTRKVNFYGFDVPGSPGNPNANRGVDTALLDAIKYLARVDSAASAAFHARLDGLLRHLRFDWFRPPDSLGYDRLSQAERDQLTASIEDLLTLLERQQARYTAASGDSDYQWAYRSAIGARQADAWLRQIPLGWQPIRKGAALAEFLRVEGDVLQVAGQVRDRAQADNLDWVMDQEGSAGKVLVFAHLGHLNTAAAVDASQYQSAGAYLRRRYGRRLVTIGNVIGGGDLSSNDFELCAGLVEPLRPALPDAIRNIVGAVGLSDFLLDLRTARRTVIDRLVQEKQGFDILFYVNSVTPACGGGLPRVGGAYERNTHR